VEHNIESYYDAPHYFLQDPVDPGRACSDPSENITEYQINIQSEAGSSVYSESVNASMCIAGRCSHTFEPASNRLNGRLPSSYDSVSVVAENVVGFGIARTCTAQHISEFNSVILHNLISILSHTIQYATK